MTASRPLTVALFGSRDSSIAELLTGTTTHGRLKLGSVSEGDLRGFLRSLRATRVDVVVIDERAEWSDLVGRCLRTVGIRTAQARTVAVSRGGGPALDIAALATAAARPGAGLQGGPDVSIVTTVLNESRAVDALITNLTTQMRPSDELVIVDGGSSDDTLEHLERWHVREPRIFVHSAPGCNVSAGRNLGIRFSRNPIIACTDAGCEPGEGWLEALRAPFAEDPAPGLVASVARIGSRSALEVAQAAACHPDPEEVRTPSLLVKLYGRAFGTVFDPKLPFARSLAFTKTAWLQADGFPEKLLATEDGLFGKAVSRHATCLATIDAEVLWHQRGSLRATYRMYRRYGYSAAQSGDLSLRLHDAARAIAYPMALLLLLVAPRRAAPFVVAGGALYVSLPVRRLARRHAIFPAALLLPLAMATKDLGKVHGAITGTLTRDRSWEKGPR